MKKISMKKISKRKTIILSLLLLTLLIPLWWVDSYTIPRIAGRQEIERVTRLMGWRDNFKYVDRIVLLYNSTQYELSAINNHSNFDDIKTRLNPFYRHGLMGTTVMVNMRRWNHIIQVAYYIGDERLFEVDIYSIPDSFYFPYIEMMLSFIGDHRVLVVVKTNPELFGALKDRTLDLSSILN